MRSQRAKKGGVHLKENSYSNYIQAISFLKVYLGEEIIYKCLVSVVFVLLQRSGLGETEQCQLKE